MSMNEPADDGGSDVTFAGLAPDWLVSNLGTLKTAVTSPVTFVRKNVAELVVGGLASVAFGIADRLQEPFSAVVHAVDAGAESFTAATTAVSGGIGEIGGLNASVLFTVADSFGPLSPVVLAGLIAAELLVGLRLLLAGVIVLEEVAGSIPLVGGALGGLSKALRTLFQRIPFPVP